MPWILIHCRIKKATSIETFPKSISAKWMRVSWLMIYISRDDGFLFVNKKWVSKIVKEDYFRITISHGRKVVLTTVPCIIRSDEYFISQRKIHPKYVR